MHARKEKLRDKLYKSFLSSALLPILIIEVTLVAMYFWVNHMLLDESEHILRDSNIEALLTINALEASLLDQQLGKIQKLSGILQRHHQQVFASLNECSQPFGEPSFSRHANGALYKDVDNGGSSVYLSSSTPLSAEVLKKLKCTEAMDPFFIHLVEHNPLISQIYFNSWDDMNRLYPQMEDAPQTFGPVLEMENYNFYYHADLEHNPHKGPVWTKAYLDPAGQGWVISNIVPIYNNDFLEGVTGIDITIRTLIEKLLTQTVAGENNVLLLDKDGGILAMSKPVQAFLGVKELTSHSYASNIQNTVLKPDSYNIFALDKQLDTVSFKQHFDNQDKLFTTEINGSAYVVSSNLIPETGWRLVMVLNERALHAPIVALHNKSQVIGEIAIIGMIIFYILFLMFTAKKSRHLAWLISEPLEKLKKMTDNIQSNAEEDELKSCQIAEIDDLNSNFNQLKHTLDSRTDSLVKTELQVKMAQREKALIEEISQKDYLTKLYNRRKMDELINYELTQAKRRDIGPGVVLFDLDYFKTINDTLGHNTGDDCLIQVAKILNTRLRETDTAARWGGEEFIVLCQDASAEGLMALAEELRQAMSAIKLTSNTPVTASFGCATYQHQDSLKELVSRADKALYQAKENGRNRCEIFIAQPIDVAVKKEC